MQSLRPTLLLSIVALVSACAVGPDYEAPATPLPDEFLNQPKDTAADAVPVARLWESLGDTTLSTLIERALAENLSIAQALATLDETRSLSNLRIFSLIPTVTTSAEDERLRESAEDPFAMGGQETVQRFRAGFDAVWEIDVFGSLRRAAERIVYLEEADAASAYAVRVAVVAEVAQTYFQWQGESLRQDLLQQNIDLQAERVRIVEAGLEAGRGTALDVARARAEQLSLAASLPSVRASVARSEQRLAVLVRQPPNELRALLGEATRMSGMPPMLAVGKPVDWLLRRPDILAAERRLAAATAAVGVEVAEYYPKLNLVGDFGWTGRTSSVVGDSSADRWRFAPGISWRILDFGRVRQTVNAAEARLAGSYAVFERTWRTALEETENAFSNYRAATERAAFLEDAAAAAVEASRLAKLRYDAGADAYLVMLDADRTRIEVEDELAQAQTDRATALAALYKALGGDFAEAMAP